MRGSQWSVVVAGGLLVLSLSWLVCARPAEAADLTRGERLYKMLCEKCHGKEGRGDGPQAKELEKKPADYTAPGFFDQHADAELKKVTLAGATPMPAFKEKLKDKDVADLLAYLKTFADRAKRP